MGTMAAGGRRVPAVWTEKPGAHRKQGKSGVEKRAEKTSEEPRKRRGPSGRRLKSKRRGRRRERQGVQTLRGVGVGRRNGENGEKEWKEERMETGADLLVASESGEEKGRREDPSSRAARGAGALRTGKACPRKRWLEVGPFP